MNITGLIKKYWPILSITVVGAILRLTGLLHNPISLFSDEVDMGYQAYSLIKTGCDYSGFCLPIQFHSFSDVQPPIPIYLIALANLVGVSLDLSIRLVPAIFGVLGILATYLLVKNLLSKKIFNIDLPYVGIFSALLLSIAPWHFTYSRIGFALGMLFFFVVVGFYFFTQYLIQEKKYHLYLSCLLLGLSPMVYNTAKMSVLFYPMVLLLLPGAIALFKKSVHPKIAFVLMFIPLVLMFLAGGTTARFDYISIFTDPTIATGVDYQRQLDSGLSAGVGASPSIATKLLHNKPLKFVANLQDNVFGLLSTDFLFTKGDPNLRHSPEGSGMLLRSFVVTLLVGTYFLIRYRHTKFLLLLCFLTFIAISASAITRDGYSHASRSFMMLLPIISVSGIGLAYLFKRWKYIFSLVLFLFFIESAFFLHNYWVHYRYSSAGSWSYGMKEVVQSSQKYVGRPIVISPKNENPLIFYAYYTRFDPLRFQKFVKDHTLYNSMSGKYNLEGNRVGDTDFYIATLVDMNPKTKDLLPHAVYFLAHLETINSTVLSVATNSAIIRLPSGKPLFYELYFKE